VSAIAAAPPSAIRLQSLPPLALYVHMPWCARKCPYCDFNSHERAGTQHSKSLPAELQTEYSRALLSDLESALPDIWGRRVHSIFFGGGTPSLFSAAAIADLLSQFRARLSLAPDCEVTLEANPGTFEAEKFRGYRDAGVNRLSIGIQSFDSAHLRALGRIHDGEEARRAIEIAQSSFENINLDLMYALPHQTLEQACADVAAALGAGVAHLSFYHLTLEPNTAFFRHPPPLPGEDEAAEMQDRITAELERAGYEHYETSAYAKPGRECGHNLNYWRFGDYLGIGAGAHSKLSFPERIVRSARIQQPIEYTRRALDGNALRESAEVGRTDLVFEFMMNALRLTQGFAVVSFVERTLIRAEARGLIVRDHERIRPTELGRRFLNDLLQLFLPER
jgi:putative oxygen-independent coproporphyrinogen III oxidase